MYWFYRSKYGGEEIPEEEFAGVMKKARHWMERCKRIYEIAPFEEEQEKMALCAVAETMYLFQQRQQGEMAEKISIGSVSCSYNLGVFPQRKAEQERELLSQAGIYLDICRVPPRGGILGERDVQNVQPDGDHLPCPLWK